ncbi:LysR family transcriptional regulator [Streptomyces malaysiensis]|uniref:LysR family transcriptional regulator n=1 Tax=Streptomyces malaysiensis TaxID=92644 RepID=UPI0037100CD7
MDLNLLVALDALLEENSVAAAADRLNLTPPAMSRTPARIRRATGDDILVRAGRTMVPTPRALELREETRDLVRRATAVLTPVRRLDLARLNRHFSVRGHDALLAALAAPLIARVGATAPNIRLSLLAESVDQPHLTRGQVDLEIGAIVTRRLPLELPPTPVVVIWHHRHDSDPAHAWLRGEVRSVLREVTDGAGRPATGPGHRGGSA